MKREAAVPQPAAGRAQPVCLALDGGDVLVLFHAPVACAAAQTAVLICPPFGWQEMCSFRGLRDWGRALAARGYPTARLSLPSAGDSAGGPHQPGRLRAWVNAVGGSADWLRANTDATRIAVLGVGLGALLAYVAACDGAGLDDLLLWALPPDGRSLVRELRTQSRIVASEFPEDNAAQAETELDLNALGYLLSSETVADLERVRPAELCLPEHPDRRVLLLARDGLPPSAALVDRLRAANATVEIDDGGDYQALMTSPQDSITPQASVELSLRWLNDGAPKSGRPAQSALRSGDESARVPDSNMSPRPGSIRCHIDGGVVSDTPTWFDGELGGIFGVLSEPAGLARPHKTCVVMVGSGALPHTGPNRAWVEAGRRWAAHGLPTLRIDLGGVGESDGDEPRLRSLEGFYDASRDRELAAVLDQLQTRGVADRFVLGGLCSGAFGSLRRTLTDERITGLLLLNIHAFRLTSDLVAERETRDEMARAVSGLRRRSSGRDQLVQGARALRPRQAWRLLRRPAERQQVKEVLAALTALEQRGVDTLLMFAGDEPLRSALEHWRLLPKLSRSPRVTVALLPSRDHMFRASWLQAHIHRTMDEMLIRAGHLDPQGAPQTTSEHSLISEATS